MIAMIRVIEIIDMYYKNHVLQKPLICIIKITKYQQLI